MIILIGYPRCATTSIAQFMARQIKTIDSGLTELVAGVVDADFVRAESVVDCVHVSDDRKWSRLLYTPGAPLSGIVESPDLIAREIWKHYRDAKIVIITRNRDDWIRSVYRYCVREMPLFRRSFDDYLRTPSGITSSLAAERQSEIIAAYQNQFSAVLVLEYELLARDPQAFMRRLCAFCAVEPGTLPQVNASSMPSWFPRPTRRRVNAWIEGIREIWR